MSRNNGKSPKVDMKINRSPAQRGNTSRVARDDDDSPNRSSSASPPSSCVSSCNNSPEAQPMVLAGCPRCLMYVMLSEEDPRCPKCKNPVPLDFLQGKNNNNNNNMKNRKS